MHITLKKMEGLAELQRAMDELAEDMRGKVARAGLRAGAEVIRKLAEAKAPKGTGNLKQNIVARRVRKPDRAMEQAIVTVRRGKVTAKQKERGIDDAFYAYYVEHGTVKMGAKPFLRPAFEQGKEGAAEAIADRLRKRIEKANR